MWVQRRGRRSPHRSAAPAPPRFAVPPTASPVSPRLRQPPFWPGPALAGGLSPRLGALPSVGGQPVSDSVCYSVCACVAAAAASRRLVSSPVAPLPPPPPAACIPGARERGLGTTMRQGGGQSAHLSRGAACRARRRAACPWVAVLLPPGSPIRLHVRPGSGPRLLVCPRQWAALPAVG